MRFSVASYNVQADACARPEWHPGRAAETLAASVCWPILVERLADLGADVLCLQEVTPPVFAAVATRLSPSGYIGHYAPRGQGKPDGCATFVREAVFSVQRVEPLRYADGEKGRLHSGHVALLTWLCQSEQQLGIANTHLKWQPMDTPTAEHLGCRQLDQLLQVLRGQMASCPTWVLAGDWNASADSPVIKRLITAGFLGPYYNWPAMHTRKANRQARRTDYLFHTPDLCSRPVPLRAIDDSTPVPTAEEPSDHLPVMAWFYLSV